MIITGIGTRNPPTDATNKAAVAPWLTDIVAEIGQMASIHNWCLRSGGADGMDLLFEYFWTQNKQIFIPWQRFNYRYHGKNGAIIVEDEAIMQEAEHIAKQVHPAWKALKKGGKLLHTRNIFQVLGPTLDQPSDVCIYYADVDFGGGVKGGTRTAVELSKMFNVPTFNLKMTDDVIALREFLEHKCNTITRITEMPIVSRFMS